VTPRFVRRRVRVFHHENKWELRADDAPLDMKELTELFEQAIKLRVPAAVHEEKPRGRATYTLKLRLPSSHAGARYRWVGKGPEAWGELAFWADRFRRFMDPTIAEALETEPARLEQLERYAEELDDDFRQTSIREHCVEWRRELTRIGGSLESGPSEMTGDPVLRLRKISAQIDVLYDVMKVEERDSGGPKNWPPPPPG
jgi:hypothetical protein